MYKLLISLVILALVGCSLLGAPIARELAHGVNLYCHAAQPDERAIVRRLVNEELAEDGHQVSILCRDDQ